MDEQWISLTIASWVIDRNHFGLANLAVYASQNGTYSDLLSFIVICCICKSDWHIFLSAIFDFLAASTNQIGTSSASYNCVIFAASASQIGTACFCTSLLAFAVPANRIENICHIFLHVWQINYILYSNCNFKYGCYHQTFAKVIHFAASTIHHYSKVWQSPELCSAFEIFRFNQKADWPSAYHYLEDVPTLLASRANRFRSCFHCC